MKNGRGSRINSTGFYRDLDLLPKNDLDKKKESFNKVIEEEIENINKKMEMMIKLKEKIDLNIEYLKKKRSCCEFIKN